MTNEQIDGLLHALNDYSVSVDDYAMGLPIMGDVEHLEKLRSIVSAHAITSMQGDSEPFGYLLQHKLFLNGYVFHKTLESVNNVQEALGQEAIVTPVFTHDKVKGVSDTKTVEQLSVELGIIAPYRKLIETLPALKNAREHRLKTLNQLCEAYASQLTTPSDNDAIDGYVLVPVEPTEEMLNATTKAWDKWRMTHLASIQILASMMYKAMIAGARKSRLPVGQEIAPNDSRS